MTADRQREFISRDAAAVIGNLDQASACLARFNPDLPRAGMAGDLLAIGRAMFARLDGKGWASAWA